VREWEIGRGERIWQVSGSALADSNLTLRESPAGLVRADFLALGLVGLQT